MTGRRVTYCLVLVLALPLSFVPSHTSTFVAQMSLEERVNRSDAIVVGEVKSIESKWDQKRTQIWTHITISVDECIKGSNLLNSSIDVIIPGGIIKEEGVVQTIEPPPPSFNMHERVVLILKFLPDSGQYALVDWAGSKFSITDSDRIYGEKTTKADLIQRIKRIMSGGDEPRYTAFRV